MTCVCGRKGFQSGCHDGVQMDDDENAEGWQTDVVYPPCPNNPKCCADCKGTGLARPEIITQDDCPACDGTGWKDGEAEWPTVVGICSTTLTLARMHKALVAGKGVRLTADELHALGAETLGEWMASAAEESATFKNLTRPKSRQSP